MKREREKRVARMAESVRSDRNAVGPMLTACGIATADLPGRRPPAPWQTSRAARNQDRHREPLSRQIQCQIPGNETSRKFQGFQNSR
jgi:hypothetical protein